LSKAIHVDDNSFEELVLKSSLPVLADFWAPWCAPCRMIAPTLDRIAADYADRLIVAKIDADQNARLAARFRIGGIPTLLFFSRGKIVHEQVGAASHSALTELLKRHFGLTPAEAA
jgi:thioredoxin 1